MQFSLFLLFLPLLFFLPGWVVLRLIPKLYTNLGPIENFLISFGVSIVLVDVYMLLLGKFGFPLNETSFLIYMFLFLFLSAGIVLIQKMRIKLTLSKTIKPNYFGFTALALVILGVTFLIKTTYLTHVIMPTSTDLAHHMYWVEQTTVTEQLPMYEERGIIQTETGHAFTQPIATADFIIGEHLPFAALFKVAHISSISAYPVLFLYLLHVATLLAIFILAIRFFEPIFSQKKTQLIGLATLFLSGPLYAIASPQAKYLSGGVVGNVFGNFFIPIIFLCFLRGIREKNSWLVTLGAFLSFGLFYTHHLSGFIFLFSFTFGILFLLILSWKNIVAITGDSLKLLLTWHTLALILFATLFILFVHTPSYLATNAVQTTVGEPSKATRAGIDFLSLSVGSGESRFLFALIALGVLCTISIQILRRQSQKNVNDVILVTTSLALLAGWFVAIFLLSWKPHWLYINIPSGRVANYVIFPTMILGGAGLVFILEKIQTVINNRRMQLALGFSLFSFILVGALAENNSFLKDTTNAQEAVQTFHSAEYLAKFTTPETQIIKDHNYIEADSWFNSFFAYSYDYPLSRAYFKRYEDPTKPREQCTLLMISAPNLPEGNQCYNDLNVHYAVVNATLDSSQFMKSDNFWKIYENNHVTIFKKK